MTATDSPTVTNSITLTSTQTFTHTATPSLTSTPTPTSTATPGFSFSLQVSQASALPGDTLTYTLNFTVTGSSAGVSAIQGLPQYMTFVGAGSVPAGGTFNFDGTLRTLTWNWPSLAPGNYQVTYQLKVDNNAPCGWVLADSGDVVLSTGMIYANNGAASVTVVCPTLTPTVTVTPGGPDIGPPIVYPNPAPGGDCQVQFTLGNSGDIRFQLFTTAFRKMLDRPLGTLPAGVYNVNLDLKDEWGSRLANGIYYVVVSNGKKHAVGKLLVIK